MVYRNLDALEHLIDNEIAEPGYKNTLAAKMLMSLALNGWRFEMDLTEQKLSCYSEAGFLNFIINLTIVDTIDKQTLSEITSLI